MKGLKLAHKLVDEGKEMHKEDIGLKQTIKEDGRYIASVQNLAEEC